MVTHNMREASSRTAVRPPGKAKRIARAMTFVVPLGLYAAAFFPALEPIVWIKALAATTLAMLCLSIIIASPTMGASAYFILGLLIAFAARVDGLGWLTLSYMPYVFLASTLFGSWGAVGFALAVPVLMAPELVKDISPEDWAVMGLSVLAAIIGMVSNFRHSGPDTSRKSRMAARPVPGPDDSMIFDSPPVNLDGLDNESDEALRELMRIAVFAARASAVSLFVLRDDELRLRCSSLRRSGGSGELISTVPKWYANDVMRLRHTIVTGNLGRESTEGFDNQAVPMGAGDTGSYTSASIDRIDEAVSIAAAPVLEGSMVTGVLAVSSPRSNAFRGQTVTLIELVSAQVARTLAGGRVSTENERDMQTLRLVYEESARLVSSIDLKEINSILAEVMGDLSGLDVSIFIRTPSGYALTFQSGPSPARPGHVDMEGTLAAMALSEGDTKYISNLRGFNVPALPGRGEDISSVLLMPLICQGDEQPLGLVALTSERTDPLKADTIEQLKMVSRQASISLKNSMFHTQMKVKAVTDPLTGLSNRRQVLEQLAAESHRAMRTGAPYSIVMMDLDHFKNVNDTWGHQAGDAVLKEVARRMRSVFRATDMLGRYGGEEFIAGLVDTGARGAVDMANRMRRLIESTPFNAEGHSLALTMSLGVAEAMQGETPERVIGRADEALYRAKEHGRNRVEMA